MTLKGHASDLAAIGPKMADAIRTLEELVGSRPLNLKGEDPFRLLSESLQLWRDHDAAFVIEAFTEEIRKGRVIETASVGQWIRAHPNDAAAVIHCVRTDPPDQVSILKLWSEAGSQKLVFLANWQIEQREVVLKRFIDSATAEQLIPRELLSHALSTKHANIIETHLLHNHNGEPFLVEKRLQDVLNDNWRSNGVAELANLLRDIGSALAYLEELGYVHGDIKPDNIGYEDGQYVLLDFGISRPLASFATGILPTGSLRTRAPELLSPDDGRHSYASDLWALGATCFLGATGRFPLIERGEAVPRVSDPGKRGAFEDELRRRVSEEYDQRVDLTVVPDPLRPLLIRLLSRDPGNRARATDVVRYCNEELAAFVRPQPQAGRFSPSDEIRQFKDYLASRDLLALMPQSELHKLKAKLHRLKESKGLSSDEILQLKDFEARLA